MKNFLAAAAMAALLPMATAHAGELITNGTFDDGFAGFYSDYNIALTHNLIPEGAYDVITDPNADHNLFSSFSDHTPGADTGLMMVVNGSPDADAVIWGEGTNANPLYGRAGVAYKFSFYLADVYPSSPANLNLWINGVKLTGGQGGLFQAAGGNANLGVWQHFTYSGVTGVGGVKSIALTNNNLVRGGNDFALDDFSMTVPEPASWALMLMGFGGLGAVLRANRRRMALAA